MEFETASEREPFFCGIGEFGYRVFASKGGKEVRSRE